MVITNAAPDIEVTIEVAGFPAQEHADPQSPLGVDDAFFVYRYVTRSQSDPFIIRLCARYSYDWSPQNHVPTMLVYLDDKLISVGTMCSLENKIIASHVPFVGNPRSGFPHEDGDVHFPCLGQQLGLQCRHVQQKSEVRDNSGNMDDGSSTIMVWLYRMNFTKLYQVTNRIERMAANRNSNVASQVRLDAWRALHIELVNGTAHPEDAAILLDEDEGLPVGMYHFFCNPAADAREALMTSHTTAKEMAEIRFLAQEFLNHGGMRVATEEDHTQLLEIDEAWKKSMVQTWIDQHPVYLGPDGKPCPIVV
ncbi:hypothetical protein MN608_01511 [Microdochium nivale]|nr:hypothetical protein MN608_01511 [Microdochium nivale]